MTMNEQKLFERLAKAAGKYGDVIRRTVERFEGYQEQNIALAAENFEQAERIAELEARLEATHTPQDEYEAKRTGDTRTRTSPDSPMPPRPGTCAPKAATRPGPGRPEEEDEE